jgi:DNA repair protein RadC
MTTLLIQTGETYREASAAEIAEAHGRNEVASANRIRPLLQSPAASRRFVVAALSGRDYEVFLILFLDNRHGLIEAVELFRGTIDGAAVHPREVVKESLLRGAAAVIFAHNHPSGVAEPSQADELITLRLKDALSLVDVRVLDHLIVGNGKVASLAELGVI